MLRVWGKVGKNENQNEEFNIYATTILPKENISSLLIDTLDIHLTLTHVIDMPGNLCKAVNVNI